MTTLTQETPEARADGRTLMLITLALLAVGVVMVHSALASVSGGSVPWYARVDMRHTLFAGLAAVVLLIGWRVDYRWLHAGRRAPWPAVVLLVVAVGLSLLVWVPGIGFERGGYHRWIRVGPREYAIGFQPSEVLKLSLLVLLAAWLSRPGVNPRSLGKTVGPMVLVIGACVAVVFTEDLGTALLMAGSAGAVLLMGGVPLWVLLGLGSAGGAGAWWYVTNDPYRWARVEAMLDPWSASNPAAYHARQSLMAVLSGGWTGRGVGAGVRKLGYLPEDSTDCIFSAFCEEWGYAGAVLLLALIVLWILHARRASVGAREPFGRLLAGALGVLVGLQAALHVAVDLVVLPPTGMSLPFISAGGTSLVILAGGTALIVSVAARAPGGASADAGGEGDDG